MCQEQHKDHDVEQIMKRLPEWHRKVEQDFVTLEDKVYHKKQMPENRFHYRFYIPHNLVHEVLQSHHKNPFVGAGSFKAYKTLYEVKKLHQALFVRVSKQII